jgi:uncharacterized cupredoxin-like copper-binding protein
VFAAAGLATGAAFAATQLGLGPVVFSLKEFKVLGPSSTHAGKVTFVIKNKGKLKHEFIVVKTNRAANKLPVKGAKVDLSSLKVEGKLKPFKPGQTKRLTLKLPKGKYVLFCNVKGHYQGGQTKGFKVS